MATPTLDATQLTASGNYGQAPTGIHYSLDPDAGTNATGSGDWVEGLWHWQLVDASGASDARISSAQRTAFPLTDPNGVTAMDTNIYERFNTVPSFNVIVTEAGTYKVRCRYRNRDGDWSAWIESGDIAIAARTGTEFFVSAGGNDSNDGLTLGNAKLTLDAAYALVSANNHTVIVDGTAGAVNLGADARALAFTGFWLKGQNSAKVNWDVDGQIIETDGTGTVMSDIECIRTTGTIAGCSVCDSGMFDYANICIVNVKWGDMNSGAEMTSGTSMDGALFYGCDDQANSNTAETRRYNVFCSSGNRLGIVGCSFINASTLEHNIRVMSQGATTGNVLEYVDVSYTTSIFAQSTVGKNALRFFPQQWGGVFRCNFEDGIVGLGSNDARSGGNTDDVYSDYCMDGCRFQATEAAASTTKGVFVYGDTTRTVVRDCLFVSNSTDSLGTFTLAKRSGTSDMPSDVSLLGITNERYGQGAGSGQRLFNLENNLTSESPNLKLRGNIIITDGNTTGSLNWVEALNVAHTGLEVKENGWGQHTNGRIWRGGSVADNLYEEGDAAGLNSGESFATSNVDLNTGVDASGTATYTMDRDTGELTTTDDSEQGVVSDLTGRHIAFNGTTGVWWDHAASVACGCFSVDGDEMATPPTMEFVAAGGGGSGNTVPFRTSIRAGIGI